MLPLKWKVNLFNQSVLNNVLLSKSSNYKIKKFAEPIEVKGPSTMAPIHYGENKYNEAIFQLTL